MPPKAHTPFFVGTKWCALDLHFSTKFKKSIGLCTPIPLDKPKGESTMAP